MNVNFRLLTDDDSLAELTDLLHAAYAQLGALGFNYTAVDQTENVTRERIAGGECYVAQKDGRLVGTILFHDVGHSKGCAWFDRPYVSTFHQFGVLPAFQNQGIGGTLLTLVEVRATQSGATEIALDTSEGASDLIRWYCQHGYREVGNAQWEGKTYRSVIMSKFEEHRHQLIRMADAWDNFATQKNGQKQGWPSVKTEQAPEFSEA